MFSKSFGFALLTALPSISAASYKLADKYVGSDFFNTWSWEAIADPTHGRVTYVDKQTAKNQNLSYASGNTFIMRADHTTTLNPSGPGRKSVRIQSNKQYVAGSTVIWDIRHMPEGCGTWPAAWTVGGDWPNNGEIDVVEGVNNVSPNQATLHTSAGCTMPGSRPGETGKAGSLDCEGNTGCGVQTAQPNSFGPPFNNNGGGTYAMERTNADIKVWFWGRHDTSIPSGIQSGAATIDTSNWGKPFASFPNTQCNIASKFGKHNLIFDLTFCGDWAGSVYSSSGCPSTCEDYVNNNPGAFKNAFWDIAYVKVFT